MKIIAYHGSQDNNIKLSDRPLYLVDRKDSAIEWAKGYGFNYDLSPSDNPTVYTIEVNFENPKYITTEEEYDELMDITNWEEGHDERVRNELKGYDGLIEEGEDYTYYMPINAQKSCKILEKEEIEVDRPLEMPENIYEELNQELSKFLN